MKTHAIIPVFIPHAGCPHDCVFCDQKAITARMEPPSPADAEDLILRHLDYIKKRPSITNVEIAFYGGSFTGIPMEEQSAYLQIASEFKKKGLVQKIHLSTRPDYIDEAILTNLKKYGVDIIELGVQSFDPQVLRLSARGHDPEAVRRAAELIHACGFTLGIQLMIGLPGDTYEKCMESVKQAIAMKPQIARIYPTVVLKDTALFSMAQAGTYTPLTEQEALRTAKDMYRSLTRAGIQVIRVGLKSTDLIRSEDGAVGAGSYHPAFRQLVEAEIAREDLEEQLKNNAIAGVAGGDGTSGSGERKRRVCFAAHPDSFSNLIGNRRSNRLYFEKKYPQLSIRFAADPGLNRGEYIVRTDEKRPR